MFVCLLLMLRTKISNFCIVLKSSQGMEIEKFFVDQEQNIFWNIILFISIRIIEAVTEDYIIIREMNEPNKYLTKWKYNELFKIK